MVAHHIHVGGLKTTFTRVPFSMGDPGSGVCLKARPVPSRTTWSPSSLPLINTSLIPFPLKSGTLVF